MVNVGFFLTFSFWTTGVERGIFVDFSNFLPENGETEGREGEFWWTDEVSPGKCVCGPQETSFKQLLLQQLIFVKI